MQRTRKSLKILHTVSACGLIGGLACYMILLALAEPGSAAAYADLRQAISAISNYVLVPSLAIALVSGLLSMAVHKPFIDKGWVLLKLALGILMFKGVLTVVAAKAGYVAALAERASAGEDVAEALAAATAYEWHMLWVVMALSVINVVLGVWRPIMKRRAKNRARPASEPAVLTETVQVHDMPTQKAA